MFYSQFLLAKNAPLRTVWCAAHLQHRLKKSHYTATDIPKTVDLIMYPEAPMALRLSSHLLLGVVRIYSKQVEYFFRDCNLVRIWLAKSFVSTQVDLTEDERQAPVELVTLPQTLNLDDFNLEDETIEMRYDHHSRRVEDITLTDQIPTGIDPYVSITFDEDIFTDAYTPMDVDRPTVPASGDADVEMGYEAGPNNEQGDVNDNLSPHRTMRDAGHDLTPSGIHQQKNATAKRVEPLEETSIEKEPIVDGEESLPSRANSTSELPQRSPRIAGSEERRSPLVYSLTEAALLPTPPPPQPPQARPRKRKQFDKVTVLTNRIMKERLEDPSDTIRKRKKLPSSKLNLWRLNKESQKDQIFDEPLLTGVSDALRSVFAKDVVSSKPYLAGPVETVPEPASVSSPPTRETETDVNFTTPIPQSTAPAETVPEPASVSSPPTQEAGEDVSFTTPISQSTVPVETVPEPASVSSPPTQEAGEDVSFTTPISQSTVPVETVPEPASVSSPPTQEAGEDVSLTTPISQSTVPGSNIPESRTEPLTYSEDLPSEGNLRLSDIPEMADEEPSRRIEPSTFPVNLPSQGNLSLSDIPEMIDEELSFLEVNGNTPVRSPSSQDSSDGLTGRTRAFAQYLKERSASSSTSQVPLEDLSLSKILEGKTRKIAARMFFETLVLKTRGLIDMQQEQPYSDITLKLMPSLSTIY